MANLVKTSSSKWLGFLQAFEVAGYCLAVGLFIWQGDRVFSKFNHFLAPVLFLLLFSVSTLICGLLVFYRPYRLFFEDKKKDAVELVLFTTLWLFFFFLAFLASAIFIGWY